MISRPFFVALACRAAFSLCTASASVGAPRVSARGGRRARAQGIGVAKKTPETLRTGQRRKRGSSSA
jgi:hypothetical protein